MSAAAPPPPPAPTPQQQQFAGYRGFGSFMVEQSVEELVAAADAGGADWAEPAWPTLALAPEAVLSACAQPAPPPAFGHGFRAAHFFLSPEWTFVNHGAFGASARVALCAAQRWREHCEAQPLACLDRELFPQLVRVLARLAALLRCRAGDLALVPNATYALNVCVAAARAELRAGDAVFMLDIGYGSVKTMLRAACASAGAELLVHAVSWPLASAAALLEQARAGLAAAAAGAAARGGRLALAVFDHVASNTALELPAAALVAAARAAGASRVLIDGAHGPQQLDLDLPALGADWYVANAHKWLCAGKGVALLYAATPAVRAATRTLVVSHGYGAGFSSEFAWDGCRDYAGVLALPALLAWWRSDAVGGHAAARAHCRALRAAAVALLVARWGTRAHAPAELYANMACVELPARALPRGAAPAGAAADAPCAATSAHAKAVQDRLFAAHVEAPVKCLPATGAAGGANMRLYVRISAAVYNELADYERLAAAVDGLRWEEGDGVTVS